MNGKSIHILLIEDSEDHIALIGKALTSRAERVQLTVARSLTEARASLAESIPDLVVIDWFLPDGKGLEFLPADKDKATFPVVMMSAHGDEQVAVQAMKAGALDYVLKSPATLADMSRIVDRALREWEQIVERKCAEEALVAANQQLRAEIANRKKAEQERDLLFERSIDMFAVSEINGTFKQVNPAWTKTLGWSEQELLSRPYIEFVHPDDHEATLAAAAQISADRNLHGFENRYRCKDGSYTWISWNAFSLPEENLTFAVARDITEQKRAETALLESEARFRSVFEASAVGIAIINPEGTVRQVNPTFCRDIGYTREECLEKNVLEVTHPAYRKESHKLYQELRSGKRQYFDIEERYLCKDGTELWGHATVAGVYGTDGALLYCVALVQNIDQRKRAEKALRKNQARINALYNHVSAGIGMLDTQGRFIEANDTWVRMLGYTKEELFGKHTVEITSPEDQEKCKKRLNAILEGQIDSYRYEKQYLKKDGSPLWVDLSATKIVDDQGTLEGVAGVIFDITEAKQAEEALRAAHRDLQNIIEFLPDPTFVIDRNKKVVAWNLAIEQMTGMRKEEILGKGDFAYAVPFLGKPGPISIDLIDCPLPELEERYDFVEKRGNTLFTEQFRPFMNGGMGAYIWATAAPLLDEDGNWVGAIESLRDITERKAIEEKLRGANRELEAFVYTVSHDLRTPLTPIMGFAEVLRESYKDRLDEQALDLLAEITKGGEKMLALMEDLLSLATVGYMDRPVEPVALTEVAQEVIDALASFIASAGVVVHHSPLPSLCVPETFLSQIFDNLIGNAIRYAGRDGGPIEIGGERRERGVRFFVRDHGPGIPEKERSLIFDVFYRGSSGQEIKGTGLGLATVQKIAGLYGGRAWVEETPGGGSTFWVEMEDVSPIVEKQKKVA